MTKKLLITDTFFVFDEHVKRLEEAGYEVSRLDKPDATEDELIEALNGVSVYIIGGVEQVTDKVIASTDALEAIIFTGVDYTKFVTGEATARAKGIQILNAPGANAIAVAEFALAAALAMQRRLFSVSRAGNKKFLTTGSIQNSVVGLVGAGNIGQKIFEGVLPFQPKEVLYYNRSAKDVAARKVGLDELVSASDVIFITLPMSAGTVLDAAMIALLKRGALVISVSPMNVIDLDALLPRLQSGEVRAAIDWPSPSSEFDELPLDSWLSMNSHSAYNTTEGIRRVSDMVTEVAIGLLAK